MQNKDEEAIEAIKKIYLCSHFLLENVFNLFLDDRISDNQKITIFHELYYMEDKDDFFIDKEKFFIILEIIYACSEIDNRGFYIFQLLKLYICVIELKSKLLYKPSSFDSISHYTTCETLRVTLLNDEDTKFRLYNVSYMNDPQEGLMLPYILKNHGLVVENSVNNMWLENRRTKLERCNTYIGSFSLAADNLPLWTQYAKNGNGCCLVFDNEFFDECDNDIDKEVYMQKNLKTQNDNDEESDYFCLYSVVYVDSNYNIENYDISDNINELVDIVKTLQSSSDYYDKLVQIVNELLNQIRFLFKSMDYEHEKELRIVKYSVNSQIAKSSTGYDKLYINTRKCIKLKEVILGPKFDKANEVAPLLYYFIKVESISVSSIKYQ